MGYFLSCPRADPSLLSVLVFSSAKRGHNDPHHCEGTMASHKASCTQFRASAGGPRAGREGPCLRGARLCAGTEVEKEGSEVRDAWLVNGLGGPDGGVVGVSSKVETWQVWYFGRNLPPAV